MQIETATRASLYALMAVILIVLTGAGFVDFTTTDKTALTNATTHLSNTSNPHSVTKSQVSLGNVENTALSTWAEEATRRQGPYVSLCQETESGRCQRTLSLSRLSERLENMGKEI